jgi:hypothetical protein
MTTFPAVSPILFFCEETTDYIETRVTEKNSRQLEITHMSFLQNNVTDAEKNVPVAGRRCISTRTLDLKMPPGGGVVAGPRTPGSLHSAPPVTLSRSNIMGFGVVHWIRRVEIQRGVNTRIGHREPRARTRRRSAVVL